MKDVVIVSACRTAIGGFGGTLKDLNGATLASVVMKEAVDRAGIDPAMIDDVRFGCCMDPTDTLNVTRVGALMAGIPDTVPAVTINRVCISGMEAVLSGMAMIQAGMADVILAGGVAYTKTLVAGPHKKIILPKEMKGVHGVHMMAIEWEHMVPQIAEQAKVLPRPVFS